MGKRLGVSKGTAVKSTDKHRFNLLFPPSLHEELELLSQYERCSLTEILIELCEECVSRRADDIEYMRMLNREIDERNA